MKPLFIETIRMENGIPLNLHRHQQRMEETLRETFGTHAKAPNLADVRLSQGEKGGRMKLRITYSSQIESLSLSPYSPKIIRSLAAVDGKDIDYHLKYADRTALQHLLAKKGTCDDILVIVDGRVTDTSYSNIAFYREGRWFVPDTCLLRGTKRQELLERRMVTEKTITIDDIQLYTRACLLNAMLDLDEVSLPTCDIVTAY